MYITRYCFAIMKNEIRTFAGSWIELQIIYSFYRKISVEFLNLLKSPQEGDYGRKEKNRGDKPIWVIIHIHGTVLMRHPV
jgi:hypothetical protein